MRKLNVGLLIMVIFVASVGAASIPTTGDIPVQTTTGFTVILNNPGTFNAQFSDTDEITIPSGTIQATSGGDNLTIPNSDLTGATTDLSSINLGSATVTVNPADKSPFTINGDVDSLGVEFTLSATDTTKDFTYSSSGQFTLELSSLTPNEDLAVLSSGGQALGTGSSDGSGDATLTLTTTGSHNAFIITNDAPTITNLGPTTTQDVATVELSADIDDTSFSKLGGDTIDVAFYDGDTNAQIGATQTVSSASTVTQSETYSTNGQKSFYVEATDQYGATTTSSTITFTLDDPEPTFANPSPSGETLQTPTPTLSIDVDDASFGLTNNNQVDVAFYNATDNTQIGSTQTITSAQTLTQPYSLTQNGQYSWYVEATDAVQTTQSQTFTFTLAEPGPVITDTRPEDGKLISEGPVDLEVDVTDVNVGSGVTVEFYDGNNTSLGNQTLTENGTASVQHPSLLMGQNLWYAEVSDTFGNTETTDTFVFSIPDELVLRDVNDPQNAITDANVDVTVRYYEEDGVLVYPRDANNGVIDMSGLPTDEEFVVGVQDDSDTYVSRLTLIDTIFEQQDVYLLKNDTQRALVRFNINDRTGDFESGTTELQILRAVDAPGTPNETEQYVIVAGDVIGGQLSFEAELEQDVRYRVRVSNEEGDTRDLGSFRAKVDQVVNLVISGISQGVDQPEDGSLLTTSQSVDDDTGDKSIGFVYNDDQNKTTSLEFRVEESNNASNVYDSGTITGPLGQYAFSSTITGDDAETVWVLNATWVRDGETINQVRPFGVNSFPLFTNMDDGWRTIFGVGLLIVLGGVFSVRNARVGAIVIPGVALVLYMTGFLSGVLTVTSIAFAFVLAVGYNIVTGSRGLMRI
jgi:hypothetical protein